MPGEMQTCSSDSACIAHSGTHIDQPKGQEIEHIHQMYQLTNTKYGEQYSSANAARKPACIHEKYSTSTAKYKQVQPRYRAVPKGVPTVHAVHPVQLGQIRDGPKAPTI
ncbi:hypothetical protein K438DRAFT_1760020 [Mycena galopus ATCC 62051]|nr:hypothetical protein K438DRAFT_1760020 [Mycena galopus ATCC 62051]